MSPGEFGVYRERCLEEYIRDGARATSMSMEEATEFANKQFAGLLPDGHETEGQSFLKLVDAAGEVVGDLWFAEQLDEDPPRVFLYDIRIFDGQRGRGLGTAAMAALEDEARRLGAAEILLSVFAHNTGAIRLYERLGYEVEMTGTGGQRMRRIL
jgi:ribosomal protein S18 acetylase RimI-like enzyme